MGTLTLWGAVASKEEQVEVEVLVAELRIKQRLALALDHLSQWSLCWRPTHGLDAAALQLPDKVRGPLRHPLGPPPACICRRTLSPSCARCVCRRGRQWPRSFVQHACMLWGCGLARVRSARRWWRR